MWTWLLVAQTLLATPALALEFGDRGGLAMVGGGGVLPAMPSYDDTPRLTAGMACLGLDAYLLFPDQRRRGKKRRYLPNNHRTVVAIEGCGGPADTYFMAFGAGAGRQWGKRDLYTTAHIVGGLGAYEQNFEDQRYEVLGIWVRPKMAAGFQLGENFAIEMGPSLHTILPIAKTFHGKAPIGQFLGVVTFDVTVLAGSGAPLRW